MIDLRKEITLTIVTDWFTVGFAVIVTLGCVTYYIWG
jgi:hypothetical protein